MKCLVTLMIIPILLIGSQCRSSKDSLNSETNTENVVKEILGSNYDAEVNESGTMTLYQKKDGMSVAYVVLVNESEEIIEKGQMDKGTVKWYDDKNLQLFYTPGIMKADQTRDDYTYIYNVRTKSKTRLKDYKEK